MEVIKKWLMLNFDDFQESEQLTLFSSFLNDLETTGDHEYYDSLSRVFKISMLVRNSLRRKLKSTQKEGKLKNDPLDKKEKKIKKIKSFLAAPEKYLAQQVTYKWLFNLIDDSE